MSQDVCLGRTAKPTEISWTRQLHRQSKLLGILMVSVRCAVSRGWQYKLPDVR